ncbi:MAG: YhbY family RNA-binding protein [Thermoproteales archaeon]|nr:YhbY family RNA-binding protein [Thermoproteales archaeon]
MKKGFPRKPDLFQRNDIVVIQVGKNGLTPNVLSEIQRNLKAHGIVKIKLLKSFRESLNVDKNLLATQVAEKLGAELIGIRGFTFILKKKKKEK